MARQRIPLAVGPRRAETSLAGYDSPLARSLFKTRSVLPLPERQPEERVLLHPRFPPPGLGGEIEEFPGKEAAPDGQGGVVADEAASADGVEAEPGHQVRPAAPAQVVDDHPAAGDAVELGEEAAGRVALQVVEDQ